MSHWLHTIARNVVISHYRLKSSKLEIEELSEKFPAKDGEYNRADTRELIFQAHFALTPLQCKLIHLRYEEDLTYAEIGRRIGCDTSWAKRRTFKAIQDLRIYLGLDRE